MKNKYVYYRVIQEFHAGAWWDSDFNQCNSKGVANNPKELKENLKLYRQNAGAPIRVITRRELVKNI